MAFSGPNRQIFSGRSRIYCRPKQFYCRPSRQHNCFPAALIRSVSPQVQGSNCSHSPPLVTELSLQPSGRTARIPRAVCIAPLWGRGEPLPRECCAGSLCVAGALLSSGVCMTLVDALLCNPGDASRRGAGEADDSAGRDAPTLRRDQADVVLGRKEVGQENGVREYVDAARARATTQPTMQP
jgi:hypothetical protein